MRIEKMLAALLAGLITLSLAGCAADKANDNTESGAVSTESSITATETDKASEPTAESSLPAGTESTAESTAEKEKESSTAPADSGKPETAKPADTESPTVPPKQIEPPKVTEPPESKPTESPKSVDPTPTETEKPKPADSQFDINYWIEFARKYDELHYMGGWMSHKGRHTTFYTMNSYKGNICYCIEPGRPLDTGLVFTQKGEDFFDNFPEAYNSTISADDIKLFLGRILQYGYTGQISDSWKSQNAEDADTMSKAFATQLLVWETVVGERDEYFNHVTPNGYNAILEQVRGDHPLRNGIMNYYNTIASAVQQHTKMPSFLSRTAGKAQTVELSWDGSRYCAELTDTNGVIGNYNYFAPGMNCVVSGNKLIITSNSAPTDKVTLTAEKKSSQRRGLIIWSDGAYQPGDGNQETVTFGQQVDDPVKGYINLKVSYGSTKIVKVSEDGKVDGITFRIRGDGIDKTVKTANGGVFQLDNLKPGSYTVSEAEYRSKLLVYHLQPLCGRACRLGSAEQTACRKGRCGSRNQLVHS